MFRVGFIVVVLAGSFALASIPSGWVERFYSRQIYIFIQNAITPLSNLVSFALFDFFIISLFFFMAWLAFAMYSSRNRRWRTFIRIVLNAVAVIGSIYLIFLLLWGLNYRREPLTENLDYSQQRITPEALVELAKDAARNLNGLYPETQRFGWMTFREISDSLGQDFDEVQRRLGNERVAVTGLPKTSLLNPYFRWSGVDGMIDPFLLEILVNNTVLPFERPFVVAHEWGHLAGYANESEASFVGWLVCLNGDDLSRYSAWLFLIPQLVRQLSESDQLLIWTHLDRGPTDDLRAVAERLSGSVPVVQRNANRIYDEYLRAHGVESGIASYGAVVDLIIGAKSLWSD